VEANKKVVQGISFGDRELLESAKSRAAALGLSLSNYVKLLIVNDLSNRKPLVLCERGTGSADSESKSSDEGLDIRGEHAKQESPAQKILRSKKLQNGKTGTE
jgi:hypothetical protein